MRRFCKSAFFVLILIAACFVFVSCTANNPVDLTPDPEASDISTKEIEVVRKKALEIIQKFYNYSSFSAEIKSKEHIEQISFAKYDDFMWSLASYEEANEDGTTTSTESVYYNKNSHVRYRKTLSSDYRYEDITYISPKEANEKSYFMEMANQIFQLFDANYVAKTQDEIKLYYGEAIPFVYNLSYTKKEGVEILNADTMFIDAQSPSCPIIMINTTITLTAGTITDIVLTTSINEKCLDRDNEDFNNTYNISIKNVNETTIAIPVLSEMATEQVNVDFYLGDTIINSNQYEINASLVALDIIEEFRNNGQLNDMTVVGLKQKGHPIIESQYLLTEKKSYDFEFILDTASCINYVSNQESVIVAPTYFITQAEPNFYFDDSQRIISGKYFAGWFEDAELTLEAAQNYVESKTLYAKWTDVNYITIIAKGVDNLVIPSIAKNHTDLSHFLGFERDSKLLDGFYSDEALLIKIDINQPISENITTLYASFSEAIYVTFDVATDIPSSFFIEQILSSDIAKIVDNTIVVNTKLAEVRGESFVSIIETIQSAIDMNFDTYGVFSNWLYNNSVFNLSEVYPKASITLKANYQIPLSVKINFGTNTVNNDVLDYHLDYDFADNVYTIKLQDILSYGEFMYNQGKTQDNSYKSALRSLLIKTTYQNSENEMIEDYIIMIPNGKVFSIYATDSLGETPADVTSAPTENSDNVIYLILMDEPIVTVNSEVEVFGQLYTDSYNAESGQYIFRDFWDSYDMIEFINVLKNSYVEDDFYGFTTDAELTNLYVPKAEWETVELFIKKIENVQITLYMGGENLHVDFQEYYNEQDQSYVLDVQSNGSVTWQDFYLNIANSVINGTLEGFTTDLEGLVNFDTTSVPPWLDLILYAKYAS
jgi:hypothetical protein